MFAVESRVRFADEGGVPETRDETGIAYVLRECGHAAGELDGVGLEPIAYPAPAVVDLEDDARIVRQAHVVEFLEGAPGAGEVVRQLLLVDLAVMAVPA